MASRHGVEERAAGLSESSRPASSINHHHHLPAYALLHHGLSHNNINPPNNFISSGQEGSGAFDFGELEEAIVLQGVNNKTNNLVDDDDDHHHTYQPKALAAFYTAKPSATLEMFPSWPIRSFQQTPRGSSKSGGGESTDSGSAVNNLTTSKAAAAAAAAMAHLLEEEEDPESPISNNHRDISSYSNSDHHHHHHHYQRFGQKILQPEMMTTEDRDNHESTSKSLQDQKRKGSAGSTSEKKLDAKTLRRLAQNREAAKKSRLRKKAYVQQLESSRLKLNQLEQDLQRARSQGLIFGAAGGNISSGAAIFDMEYARWLEDDHRHMAELRSGLQAHLTDADLRVIIDGYISHYDEIFQLKGVAAKSDVFHLITGMWITPAERCFLWMGGFRPSDLIKMLKVQLDPLTEQQMMGIYKLQQSSQQAEDALSQGLDQLHQSLVDTIAAGPLMDGMNQMALAIGKLSNLEGFVRQADILRQQTLHQLRRILTVRQAARCYLVIGEYYNRLRALSSLWASRPRESLMNNENSCQTTTELQMIIQPSHNQFSNF